MHHFTYKTTHPNGKYYVGRHSTTNLNDGYVGSGSWIREIKDKTVLTVEILNYFETFEDLLVAEEKLINDHINQPNNMNWNKSPVGFSTGDLNPSCRPNAKEYLGSNYSDYQRKRMVEFNQRSETREKRSQKCKEQFYLDTHNFQDPEFKERDRKRKSIQAKTNNPMFKEEQKERHRKVLQRQLEEGTHNFQNPEIRKKVTEINRRRWTGDGNPMKNPEVAKKLKKPKPKVTCPHCNKTGGKPVMTRYHFDNCKHITV